jgi:hypothetical protein
VAEGYLTSRGGYTQVASAQAAAPPRRRTQVRAAWLRSVRRVLTEAADERLGYLDGHGAVELRSELAAYLNRVRGTNADPETIVITNGYAQAVSLLIGVLTARGARTVAVEDPSASDDARHTNGRPGACSAPKRAPRYSRGLSGPGRWSSRTTTTPNTAVTAPPLRHSPKPSCWPTAAHPSWKHLTFRSGLLSRSGRLATGESGDEDRGREQVDAGESSFGRGSGARAERAG